MESTLADGMRQMTQALNRLIGPTPELEKCANCEECGAPIYPDYTLCAECEGSDGPDPYDDQVEQEMEQERRTGW